LPAMPYDCAVIRSTGANACCRLVLDTNRYTVPYLYASQKLTLKLYPDRLLAYHNEKLIATHPRCFDRFQDIRNPDHIQDLLVYRQRARQQTLLQAFLSLGPGADLYASRLQEKRLNAPHHIQKIVALSQIYGTDKTVRALGDAHTYERPNHTLTPTTGLSEIAGRQGALQRTGSIGRPAILEPRRILEPPHRRPISATPPAHRPTPPPGRAFPRFENARTVPMGLAQENQPPPSPKPLSPGVPGPESQRDFFGNRWVGKIALGHRAGLRRLPGMPLRPLRQRH